MKTLRNILYVLLVSMLAVSCTRDYETPPFDEPSYSGATNNITIAEFRTLYASATTTATAIDSGLILKATVVGNDVSGNIYKNLYIQDETGGMIIGIDQSSIYSTYQLGQQIYLNMDGLSVLTYGGELEIGYSGTTASRVPWDNFVANASLDQWPDTTRFEPTVVKISDLDGNSSTLMNTLVEFDSVYFSNGGEEPFAVSSSSTSVNQTLMDADGNSITVRNSTYADFAADTLPKGYGKVVGVLGRYSGTWQLMLRSEKDVKDFDGSSIGSSGDSDGEGTAASPYNVAAAMENQGSNAYVTGYIVGCVDGTGMSISTESLFASPFTVSTNILLADSPTETSYSNCLPVQLPSGTIRSGLNLVDNEGLLGTKVTVYGSLETYFTVSGLKSTSYYILADGTTGGTDPSSTTTDSYTLATSVSAGTYVFAANNSGTYEIFTPLAESYSYGYISGTAATISNNTLSTTSTNAFTVAASTNGYTIQDTYGRYLYMSGTYNSFNVSTTKPSTGADWTFTQNSDGTFTIMNVAMSKYIQYSTSYSSYGSYSSSSGIMPYAFVKN